MIPWPSLIVHRFRDGSKERRGIALMLASMLTGSMLVAACQSGGQKAFPLGQSIDGSPDVLMPKHGNTVLKSRPDGTRKISLFQSLRQLAPPGPAPADNVHDLDGGAWDVGAGSKNGGDAGGA